MKVCDEDRKESPPLIARPVIFPLDYEQRSVGIITDDVSERGGPVPPDELKGKLQIMNDLLVRPIPDGCRLTVSHPRSFSRKPIN